MEVAAEEGSFSEQVLGLTSGSADPAALLPGYRSPLERFVVDRRITRPERIWHLDTETWEPLFVRALRGHGLTVRGTSPAARLCDRIARERVVARALERVNEVFLRRSDGRVRHGVSFRLAFTAEEPDLRAYPGGPGIGYSRICFASRGNTCRGATLGAEYYDPGNRRAESACEADGIGVFAARICGVRSVLGRRGGPGPRLRVRDLKLVDGSYALGDGSPEDDDRFRAISRAIYDWGTALGNVTAHEIGHGLGLPHDRVRGYVMQPSFSQGELSDPGRALSPASVALLDRWVGRVRR